MYIIIFRIKITQSMTMSWFHHFFLMKEEKARSDLVSIIIFMYNLKRRWGLNRDWQIPRERALFI